MPISAVPYGKCIVTCFTGDGRRCWFVAGVIGGAGAQVLGYDPPSKEVADQLASLDARIAWQCYGPPTERQVPGPASSRCNPVFECEDSESQELHFPDDDPN